MLTVVGTAIQSVKPSTQSVINAGEEITISYDKGGPSDSRRTYLQDAFGLDCNCSVCSLPLSELQISNARRLQIQHLDDGIGDSDCVMNRPDDCLPDCHSLLQVLEEEYQGGAGALIARLYYDAFQISITHGDQARARVFAEKGHQSRVRGGCGDKGGRVLLVGENMLLCQARCPNLLQTHRSSPMPPNSPLPNVPSFSNVIDS